MGQQWRERHFGLIFISNFFIWSCLAFIFYFLLFGCLVKPAEPEVAILLTLIFTPQWIISAIEDPIIKYELVISG